jgi:uncharacterized membrane protein
MGEFDSDKIVSENDKTCSTGLTQELSVLVIYLFGWLSGLIFLLVEQRNQMVRFHAMQSIVLSVGATVVVIGLNVLSIIPLLGLVFALTSILVSLGALCVGIFVIYKNFNGENVRLPVIGDLAEKWLSTV